MKLTYKKRIFLTIFILFTFFTITMVIVEQHREKEYKTKMMETTLSGYADVVHSYLIHKTLEGKDKNILKDISRILPNEIRITIISKDGDVLYDDEVNEADSLENHLGRPEIQKAIYWGDGTNIRKSSTTDKDFLYYAKYYPNYFVRVAIPYNISTEKFLNADNIFIYISLSVFLIMLIILNIVAKRFNKSIIKLKNFVTDIKENNTLPANISFPDDDLGQIGEELIEIFKQKEQSKKEIEQEKEKLILHFHYIEEGVAIFDSKYKNIYFNSYFIQYLNFIADVPILSINSVFEQEFFEGARDFLDNDSIKKYFSIQINKNNKIFLLQVVKFEDKSFEIIIKDITRTEKTRLIKQEMANNITHELRTPISSIRAYLETMEVQEIPVEKQKQFINRAYLQSVRLSNLVDDICLISKIEEAEGRFKKELVNIYQLINDIRINLLDRLQNNRINLKINIDEKLAINANYTLVFSIFQNLIDNSINYGGDDIEIVISNYMKDSNYLYFSYYDTGEGVEEKHFGRLFERFYRVDEGRSRNSGGTGLGLSIVKNAVLLHEGTIQVKSHVSGGLEFLFTLKR